MKEGRGPLAAGTQQDGPVDVVGPLRPDVRGVSGAAVPRMVPDGGMGSAADGADVVGIFTDGVQIDFGPDGLLDDAAEGVASGGTDGARNMQCVSD